jgi:hypothetical protein
MHTKAERLAKGGFLTVGTPAAVLTSLNRHL